jgi:hypothetical protein
MTRMSVVTERLEELRDRSHSPETLTLVSVIGAAVIAGSVGYLVAAGLELGPSPLSTVVDADSDRGWIWIAVSVGISLLAILVGLWSRHAAQKDKARRAALREKVRKTRAEYGQLRREAEHLDDLELRKERGNRA